MAAVPNVISTKGKKIVSVFILQSKRLISFHQQFCEFLISFFAKHNTFKVSPNVLGKAFTKISSCRKLNNSDTKKAPGIKSYLTSLIFFLN